MHILIYIHIPIYLINKQIGIGKKEKKNDRERPRIIEDNTVINQVVSTAVSVKVLTKYKVLVYSVSTLKSILGSIHPRQHHHHHHHHNHTHTHAHFMS